LRQSALVSIFGIGVPALCAIVLTFIFHKEEFVDVEKINRMVFFLFMTVVMGISALPVLARILSEYRLMETKIGIFSLSVTTLDDLIAWPLLALTLAFAGASSMLSILWIFLSLVTFGLILFFPARYLLHFIAKKTRHQQRYSQVVIFSVLAIVFSMAWICETIGLSAIVGAFLTGLVVPRYVNLPHQLTERIEDLITVVFLPLFFTISGLKTQFGLLNTGELWGYTVLVIFFALFSKIIGGSIPAKYIAKFDWPESLVFGVLMSAKGLVALISLNLGISHHIITEKLFAI
jgi:Kef-type K+ transport system membrane component KefB